MLYKLYLSLSIYIYIVCFMISMDIICHGLDLGSSWRESSAYAACRQCCEMPRPVMALNVGI